MKRRIVALGALLALAGVLLPVPASADGTVGVELAEFSITAGASTIEAGAVTLNVDNLGSFGHELLVVRTDLAADALPTGPGDGQADESQLDVVGEVRPAFDGGTSQTVTLNLEAGGYVLICNIFNDAFPPGHYGRRMATSLTVTPVPAATSEAGAAGGRQRRPRGLGPGLAAAARRSAARGHGRARGGIAPRRAVAPGLATAQARRRGRWWTSRRPPQRRAARTRAR